MSDYPNDADLVALSAMPVIDGPAILDRMAELRRSACEDEMPFMQCGDAAYWVARDHCDCAISAYPDIAQRTFYLLVAKAMESA